MKKYLSLILALCMILSMAACGAKEETPAAPAETTTTPAETTTTPEATGRVVNGEVIDEVQYLNYINSDEPGTLDEFHNSVAATGVVLSNLFTPLVRNMNGVLVGDGAESWETSEDGLTWTFHLRDNNWEDGTPVTSQDYLYSIQMKFKPETAFPYSGNWYPIIKNGEAVINGGDMSLLGVTTPDDKTIVIETEYVCPSLLNTLTFYPQKQEQYEKYGDKYGTEAETVLSCGPFKLDSWTHNSSLEFSRNEQYWDAENVYLEKMTFHTITENSTQYNMLDNGSVDYLSVADQDFIERFNAREDLVNTRVQTARTFLWFFNQQDKFLANEKVRKAITVSFDRDATVNVLLGGVPIKAEGLYTYVMMEGDKSIREASGNLISDMIAYVPDAKALLAEGLAEVDPNMTPEKWTVKCGFGSTGDSMKTQAEYWQSVLINTLGVGSVELSFDDYATAKAGWDTGAYQIACLSWGSSADTTYMLNLFKTESNTIPTFWNNAEYDAIVTELSKTVDPEKRLELEVKAEHMLIDACVICPISYNCSNVFEYNYVRGVDRSPFGSSSFKTVYTVGRP